MSRLSFAVRSIPILGMLLAGVLLGPNRAQAQPPAAEPVSIITADGVKIKGLFYPSTMKNQPTVIMLHPVGEGKSSDAPEWKALAEALQKANYSVMTFDFRGHGASKTIDDPALKGAFWGKQINAMYVKPKDPKEKETIDVKDYIKAGDKYLPVLVNDIAAVRAYLERRNDSTKDCNTSSIIVIGAESGATLGAVWINSESYRYKGTVVNALVKPPLVRSASDRAEGCDIMAAVFLTVQPELEKRKVSVAGLLKTSCKDKGMAAAFFFGGNDPKAKGLDKTLETNLKVKGSKKHDFIGAVELDTNLSGIKLLQKGLKTDTAIVDYLNAVSEERKAEWAERDFQNTFYVWQVPATKAFMPARSGDKTVKTLVFDDYNKFIPSK